MRENRGEVKLSVGIIRGNGVEDGVVDYDRQPLKSPKTVQCLQQAEEAQHVDDARAKVVVVAAVPAISTPVDVQLDGAEQRGVHQRLADQPTNGVQQEAVVVVVDGHCQVGGALPVDDGHQASLLFRRKVVVREASCLEGV